MPSVPVLDGTEADRRAIVLVELQSALDGLGIRCVLARRHRLVLRYNDPPPLAPSGPVSPTLHIFAPGRTFTASTDGTVYWLDDDRRFPVGNPAAAAAAIRSTVAPPSVDAAPALSARPAGRPEAGT